MTWTTREQLLALHLTEAEKRVKDLESDLAERGVLLKRYQACALQIWQLFDQDPLPDSDPAQSYLERLERVLINHQLGPNVEPSKQIQKPDPFELLVSITDEQWAEYKSKHPRQRCVGCGEYDDNMDTLRRDCYASGLQHVFTDVDAKGEAT